MRILFIGGTRMTGPFAVRDLIAAGHDVYLLHRSHSDSPLLQGATQLQADKADLAGLRRHLASLRLDVAVHMAAFTWERAHPQPHDPKEFDYAAEDAAGGEFIFDTR